MGFAVSSSSSASNFSEGLAANATPWLAPLAGWLRRRAMARKPGLQMAPPVAHPVARPAAQPIVAPVKPLRVLRVVDGAPRQCAGRMVISGRMADVCAELDRLVAREAQRSMDRHPGTH